MSYIGCGQSDGRSVELTAFCGVGAEKRSDFDRDHHHYCISFEMAVHTHSLLETADCHCRRHNIKRSRNRGVILRYGLNGANFSLMERLNNDRSAPKYRSNGFVWGC